MFNKITILIISGILLLHSCSVPKSETDEDQQYTYNGILEPDIWPPRYELNTERAQMIVPYLDNTPKIIPINHGRQLFVDDFLIEETDLERHFHYPKYFKMNPVLQPDKTWETTAYGTPYASPFSDGVWFDEMDGKFKMWYLTGGSLINQEAQSFITSYAESLDGKNWYKPDLSIVPGTNIVDTLWRDSNSIWLDKGEKDSSKRFKMFEVCFFPKDKRWRIYLRYSKDGIHWSDGVAQSGDIYDRSTVFYNPFRKMWVVSLRSGSEVGRARQYLENECPEIATSLAHRVNGPFKDKHIVDWFTADEKEPRHPNFPDVDPQIYNHDAIAYESVMLGFFSVWQGPDNHICDSLKIQKRNEVCIGYSRDGFHWSRPDHTPFLGANETEGAWNWGNIQSVIGSPIIVGDSLYFYVSGRRLNPQMWDGNTSTGLGILRRDGFVSMASETEGILLTRKLSFSGEYLFINADVSKGDIKVEILDEEGSVIKGFSKEDCIVFSSNSTKHKIQWKTKQNLSSLQGATVKFKFYVTKGDLFSFWVSSWDTGESRGITAGGGPGLNESGIDLPN